MNQIPTGKEWQCEPKWDGFRCLVFRDGPKIELQSKAGQSLTQTSLFGDAPELPDGMTYGEEIISPREEQVLIGYLAALPLQPFQFIGGLKGNRKVISFGWRYDWGQHQLQEAEPIPSLLRALRDKAARFAGMKAESLAQVLVTEYAPGAGIGWHKDRPHFDQVVGVSLLAACNFRLRRKTGATWERRSFTALPRSAYLLSGASRTSWEHSIPALSALRYSVTYRSFR